MIAWSKIRIKNQIPHPWEFYETCDRVRPFQCLDKTEENFELENTKPIFNENLILTVHNLYTLSILTESWDI